MSGEGHGGVPSQVWVVWPIPRQLHEPQTFRTSNLPQVVSKRDVKKDHYAHPGTGFH
jgi:hypothetical protein